MYYTIIAKQSDYTKEQFEKMIRAYTPPEPNEKLNQYGVWKIYAEYRGFANVLSGLFDPHLIWDVPLRKLFEKNGFRIGDDNNIYIKTNMHTDSIWDIKAPTTCGEVKRDNDTVEGFIENGQLYFTPNMSNVYDSPIKDGDIIKDCSFADNEPVHIAEFHI